jgi:hypothetical protein
MSRSAPTVVQGGRGARGSTTPTNHGLPMARAEIGTAQAVWLAGHALSRMAVRTWRGVRSWNPDRCPRPDRRSPSSALRMGAVTAPSRTRPLPHRHVSLADRRGCSLSRDGSTCEPAATAADSLSSVADLLAPGVSLPAADESGVIVSGSSDIEGSLVVDGVPAGAAACGKELRDGRACCSSARTDVALSSRCRDGGSSHQSLRSGRTPEWCGSTGESARGAGLVARACRRLTASAQSLVGRRGAAAAGRAVSENQFRVSDVKYRRVCAVVSIEAARSLSMPWTRPRADRPAMRLGRPRRARGTP